MVLTASKTEGESMGETVPGSKTMHGSGFKAFSNIISPTWVKPSFR